MAKTQYALRSGSQNASRYTRPYNKKATGKKSTYVKKVVDKTHYEYAMAYDNGTYRAAINEALSSDMTDGTISCVHTIPVQITGKLVEGFNINVKDKYEESRIAKLEVKIMFKNTDAPVWYLIEESAQAYPHPSLFVNNPKAGYKMVKENNNTLVITWKPTRGSSDNDLLTDTAILAKAPFAYIKLLQYGMDGNGTDIAAGKVGCIVHTKATLACKGLKLQKETALTTAQVAAITANLN
jgi:hypothetical protein